VLELVRLGRIRTQQTELFGEIVIERHSGETHAGSKLTSWSPALRLGHPAGLARLARCSSSRRFAAARELVEELSARYTDRGLQIVEVGRRLLHGHAARAGALLVPPHASRTKQRLTRPAPRRWRFVALRIAYRAPKLDAVVGGELAGVLDT